MMEVKATHHLERPPNILFLSFGFFEIPRDFLSGKLL
jgi:hypothetical protein